MTAPAPLALATRETPAKSPIWNEKVDQNTADIATNTGSINQNTADITA
ncbi:hypothetical protein LTSEMIS_4940, partial [Salmonella enterica subsp. enterica serovar Mississippi str. A4-633]